jgi:cell division protein FtsB
MPAHPSNRNRGPRGRTGPGRGPGAPRPARQAAARPEPATAAASGTQRPRSRLTGRAAVLVLVLAVLTVSYASSLRAYLQQRAHINDLKVSIAQHEADIDALETEKERWDDPAYVQQQARERLGYVMPGEKTYLVLGEDGKPLEPAAELEDPATVISSTQDPWWNDAWASVELAGNPPRATRPPATEIDGTKKGTGGEDSAGETPEAP